MASGIWTNTQIYIKLSIMINFLFTALSISKGLRCWLRMSNIPGDIGGSGEEHACWDPLRKSTFMTNNQYYIIQHATLKRNRKKTFTHSIWETGTKCV